MSSLKGTYQAWTQCQELGPQCSSAEMGVELLTGGALWESHMALVKH